MGTNTDHIFQEIILLLKDKKIWNTRISKKLSKAKSIKQAKHIANLFIEQQNRIKELQRIASENQIDLSNDFLYAYDNIDKCDIKLLRKKVNEILEFKKYKQKSYDALSQIPLSETMLNSIKGAKDKRELENILHPIPYQVLKKYKLVKSPKDIGLTTKNSVRAISTNMKNQ